MKVQTILLPRDLRPDDVADRTVVVFDVLRATTTITAGLAAGVAEIQVFDGVDAAAKAAARRSPRPILCGEVQCLRPPGFDLGNSPRQWDAAIHKGATVYLATTNGTRAVAAAAALRPGAMLVAAMVNAKAAAQAIRKMGKDVTLLCSGTQGQISMEDLLGTGAVVEELNNTGPIELSGDAVQIARLLYSVSWKDLPGFFRTAGGGLNLINALLESDIDFCAKVNTISIVGQVHLPDAPLALRIFPFPTLEE